MDKKTILALVLMSVVFGIYALLNIFVFKPAPAPVTESVVTQESTETATTTDPANTEPVSTMAFSPEDLENADTTSFSVKTDLYDIVFTPVGGAISKLVYKVSETDKVDLLLNTGSDLNAFDLYWGTENGKIIKDVFLYTKTENSGKTTVSFNRRYVQENGSYFDLVKEFEVFKNDPVFKVKIRIENSENDVPPLDRLVPYTILTFPQIGPDFDKLGGNYGEYRNFKYLDSGKVKKPKLKNGVGELNLDYYWTGVEGKYFTTIIKPATTTKFVTVYKTDGLVMDKTPDAIFLRRPSIQTKTSEEIFSVYAGPKKTELLKSFNSESNNSVGLSNMNFDKMISGSFWWFLVLPLEALMGILFALVKNYGIAIVLMSIVVKMVLWPLTNYGEKTNKKMQSLTPKIEELKKKYANDQQKANIEMNLLYQKEKINPLMGCLPMLLQLPIFLAVFDMMNKNYIFRGAVFIPGWITDLSRPEYILNWGIELPFLGSFLRLLPIIYLASQLLSSLLTPMASGTSTGQMKFMTFGLPIVFFFVLYGMPSGLLIFWTMSNVLGIVQNVVLGKIHLPWMKQTVKS